VLLLASFVVVLSGVGGAGAAPASTSSTPVVAGSLTGGLDPQFVGVQGETFFTSAIAKVQYDGGPVFLSSTSNGLSATIVDDSLTIKVTHPDGTTASYSHDYSGGCGPDVPLAPKDLSSKFMPGENKVVLTLKDKCGGGESASAIWLAPQSHVYWMNRAAPPESIGRANLDGTDVNQNFIGIAGDLSGSFATDPSHLYWLNNYSLGRANLDGTGVNPDFLDQVGGPGTAVDANHIYWIDGSGIGRANLDGTGVNAAFISDPNVGLAVTVDAGHLYWTRANGLGIGIGRANLDGTGVDLSFMTGIAALWGLAVDAHHIYWDQGQGIGRANLDGTHIKRSFIAAPLSDVGAIAVNASNIYWTQTAKSECCYTTVGRANLDGTGVNPSFISTISAYGYGLALDTPAPAPMLSSPGPNPAFSLTGGVDHRLVDTVGETFFTATVSRMTYSSGPVFLAGSKDGTASTLVDDALKIKVVHQDGTTSSYSHDYSGGCGPDTPLAPTNLASKFKPGVNKVTVTLTDVCGGGVSSSALWLTPGS
jgi:hypothetical protein